MRRPPVHPVRFAVLAATFLHIAIAFALALPALPVAAGPTLGFIETFPAASGTAGWLSSAENTNPGTGGVGGAGDGYLRIARSGFAAQLGSHNVDTSYAGNYLSAGVERIKFSLNDVGANQNLEIHFVLGNSNSFWLYTTGFIPPENAWAEFTVDLADTAGFTQIIDFVQESFSEAMTTVDRVHIRHDVAPFVQTPNSIIGEFGLDDFKIEGTPVGVEPPRATPGRPVLLAAPFPNPSRGTATFAYETFDDAPVTIAVVDVRGRILRRETLAPGTVGRQSWTFDGRDGDGRKLAAGAYRVRAYSRNGGTSRPLVVTD